MANSFYNHSTYPTPNSPGSSAQMRAELQLVANGFDKMPALSAGVANRPVMVNSAGTALVTTTALGGLDITGSTINGTPIGSITPAPGAFTTLAVAAAAALGSNVTINGGAINGTAIGGVTPAAGAFTTLSAISGITGNLTGNVTGNLTGNVTGNVTGNLTGNVTSTGTSTFNNVTINGTLNMDAGSVGTIENLSAPVNSGDAANKGYVDAGLALKLNLAGGTMSGPIGMGGQAITNLATPAANADAATKGYVDAQDALKLNLSGGTMTGPIAMGANRVTGVGDPTAAQDAATRNYVDTKDALKLNLAGGTMSGPIAMGANKITGLADPAAAQDAVTLNYVTTLFGSTASAAASASAANTSAINAAASATNANIYAGQALTSANNAAASYDAFDDRYLGSKTADPTTDNDGNALIVGALYWNTTSNVMRVWKGGAWESAYVPSSAYASVSLDGPLEIVATEVKTYTITDYSVFSSYAVSATAGTVSIAGNQITYTAPATAGAVTITVTRDGAASVFPLEIQEPPSYIATPAATPANFGDPFEGGFYAGMIWNQLTLSGTSKTLATGTQTFTVPSMTGAPIVYQGQTVEVRSRANPANKFVGTVTKAAGTTLTVNVASIEGSGTFSDWSVMARHRIIVAPKASGENAGVALKNASTAFPTACQTLTEGFAATQAMRDADTSTVYPAAHWARALNIGGKTDWYIPARDELELLWRNLKPVTNDNDNTANRPVSAISYQKDGSFGDSANTHGTNPNSSPAGSAYIATVPGQTAATAFQSGGTEAFTFGSAYYWSSSEYSASSAWCQFWLSSNPGFQNNGNKTLALRVRAVRRSVI